MKKSFIIAATLTLGLVCGGIITTPVIATEDATDSTTTNTDIMPINETDSTTSTEGTVDTTTDETTVITDETTETEVENIEAEGTSGEAELVCTEESDENCAAETETTEEEPASDCELDEEGNCIETSEPELWPMVLSLGAIGVTVIITIILAVAGRKQK